LAAAALAIEPEKDPAAEIQTHPRKLLRGEHLIWAEVRAVCHILAFSSPRSVALAILDLQRDFNWREPQLMCPERKDLLEVLRAASAHVRALRQLEIEALKIEDDEELGRLASLVERAVESRRFSTTELRSSVPSRHSPDPIGPIGRTTGGSALGEFSIAVPTALRLHARRASSTPRH
jgi:hypothetical protein